MTTKSEDQLCVKFDRCVADSIVKFGGGILVGSAFSLMFFKRRMWPITLGAGVGIGMAYANCQRSFDEPFLVRADVVQKRSSDSSSCSSCTGGCARTKSDK